MRRAMLAMIATTWCACGFQVPAGLATDADPGGETGPPAGDAPIDAGCEAPAAHWRFDDGAGLAAADSSGHGNALTLHAATWGAGKQGMALDLTGNAWADRPFDPAFTARRRISVTAWVYPIDSRVGGIVVKSARLGPLMDWGFYVIGSEAAFLYNYQINQAYPSVATTGMGIPQSAWSHVGFVVDVDAGTVAFYLNGALHQALPNTIELAQHDTEPISVGTDGGNAANDFVGRLDEITVWTRALTGTEIKTLFEGDCLR